MGYYNKFYPLLLVQPLHPYTQRYIAAMSVKPTARIAKVIDNFVRGLIEDGLWDKFDAFYIFKMHDAQAARINLVNPGTHNLSVSGSPVFTAGSGYAGAVSGYLQTSANMNTFSKFTQNNAHLGIFAETSVSANSSVIGNSLNNNEIRPYYSVVGGLVAMCNAAYDASESIRATASGIGHTVVARPNSTQYFIAKNGAQLGSTNTENSVTVAAATLKVCAGNNTTQLSFAHAGSALTVGEIDDLYQRILTYRSDYP